MKGKKISHSSRILVRKFYGKLCAGVVQETVWERVLNIRNRDDQQKDHLTASDS